MAVGAGRDLSDCTVASGEIPRWLVVVCLVSTRFDPRRHPWVETSETEPPRRLTHSHD